VLQSVIVCWSVLECVAECCSVLQQDVKWRKLVEDAGNGDGDDDDGSS